jgi:hypothetical protein
VVLLAIPGTPVGPSQVRHDGDQFHELVMIARQCES